MKIKICTIQHLVFLTGMLFCLACSDERPSTVKIEKVEVAKNPFKFYKDIEVKPGLNFEVLSWGKGPDSIGAYQILMSDSVKNHYKSLSAERKGIINDAWNMDLDHDGNPEIYIQLLSKKNVLDLNVYEFSNGDFNKISFPSLTANQKKSYSGSDRFFIKDGELFRAFPAKNITDSTKTLTKTFGYKLSGNSFSASEVKVENNKP